MSNPLVTVNVLSFNRKEELRNTLNKVFKQDYKNIEVIVIDNASEDGTPDMVENQFPKVKLIKLNKNIGISGWNKGFEIAKGDFVLVLDDDAYPSNFAISLSVNQFEYDESIACVAFNVLNYNKEIINIGNWLPTKRKLKQYWPIFIGCAFMVKINRLKNKIEFPKNYFIYQHELPVAADIHIENRKILYDPEIIAYHNFKEYNSYIKYNDQQVFKNNLLFISKYLPIKTAILHISQIIIFFLTRSLRQNWFRKYLDILIHNEYHLISNSDKINEEYYHDLKQLKLFNYSILSKFKKS